MEILCIDNLFKMKININFNKDKWKRRSNIVMIWLILYMVWIFLYELVLYIFKIRLLILFFS